MSRIMLAVVVLLTLVINSTNGFWRMPVARSGLARIDPLVDFDQVSEHAHAIHGSSGLSANSTYDDLLAAKCTSCSASQDKSAYWTPAIYFQDADTKHFELVEEVGNSMLAYYLLYKSYDNEPITAFPAGFCMLAGDTDQRTFNYPVPDIDKSHWNVSPYNTQDFLSQAALGFNCMNYGTTPEGSLFRHFMPDKSYLDAHCADGLRFETVFPSCWNGVDLDSSNHKDHVKYPSLAMTGDCPEGFTKRLPTLFYETIWATNAFKDRNGQFVISNGDTTGFGYHADFINGWNVTFLQSAVDTCTNLSGEIQDCPLFDIQDAGIYSNCNITIPEALVDEDVVGPISALPGNNPVDSSPSHASGSAAPTSSKLPVSVPVSSAVSTAASAASSMAAVKSTSGPTVSYPPANIPNPITIPSEADSQQQPLLTTSTVYTTSDAQIIEEIVIIDIDYITIPASTPVLPTKELAARHAAHLHQHQHAHAQHARTMDEKFNQTTPPISFAIPRLSLPGREVFRVVGRTLDRIGNGLKILPDTITSTTKKHGGEKRCDVGCYNVVPEDTYNQYSAGNQGMVMFGRGFFRFIAKVLGGNF